MKDAFGQAILAYFKRRDSYLIIERDDGYFDVNDPKSYFSECSDWPDHHKKAMKLAKGRVIDVGCGPGRHSLYLQKKGFDVTGIDISPIVAKVCELRGLRKVKVMSTAELGRFKPSSFDTVVMMGNNFGLFGSVARARSLLGMFGRVTTSSGLLIAESTDPYKTRNPFHLRYHRLNRRKGRMAGQVRIGMRYQKYAGDWFDCLLVSKKEMQKILVGTGWRVKEFIESGGPQYVAVIKKT